MFPCHVERSVSKQDCCIHAVVGHCHALTLVMAAVIERLPDESGAGIVLFQLLRKAGTSDMCVPVLDRQALWRWTSSHVYTSRCPFVSGPGNAHVTRNVLSSSTPVWHS